MLDRSAAEQRGCHGRAGLPDWLAPGACARLSALSACSGSLCALAARPRRCVPGPAFCPACLCCSARRARGRRASPARAISRLAASCVVLSRACRPCARGYLASDARCAPSFLCRAASQPPPCAPASHVAAVLPAAGRSAAWRAAADGRSSRRSAAWRAAHFASQPPRLRSAARRAARRPSRSSRRVALRIARVSQSLCVLFGVFLA